MIPGPNLTLSLCSLVYPTSFFCWNGAFIVTGDHVSVGSNEVAVLVHVDACGYFLRSPCVFQTRFKKLTPLWKPLVTAGLQFPPKS
jgi:hypothetical protein